MKPSVMPNDKFWNKYLGQYGLNTPDERRQTGGGGEKKKNNIYSDKKIFFPAIFSLSNTHLKKKQDVGGRGNGNNHNTCPSRSATSL